MRRMKSRVMSLLILLMELHFEKKLFLCYFYVNTCLLLLLQINMPALFLYQLCNETGSEKHVIVCGWKPFFCCIFCFNIR